MGLDRTAAANYAIRHARNYNTNYIRYGNDCTNFVSQCMQAGGWQEVTGWYRSNTAWWYTGGIFGFRAASYTWAGAQNFFSFTTTSGRGAQVSDASGLKKGDVIHIKQGGSIYHSMIITGFKGGDPLLSYHTSDTLNKPLSEISAGLRTGHSLVYVKMA